MPNQAIKKMLLSMLAFTPSLEGGSQVQGYVGALLSALLFTAVQLRPFQQRTEAEHISLTAFCLMVSHLLLANTDVNDTHQNYVVARYLLAAPLCYALYSLACAVLPFLRLGGNRTDLEPLNLNR